MNFSKVFPNLKIAFCIQPRFKICISSCSCNRYSWSRIFTYHTCCWRNSYLSDSKSGKGIAVSCGYWNCYLNIHRRKNEWHYEFNKLEDQNIKLYLSLVKKIALIASYIFVASLKRSSRYGSSNRRFKKARSSPLIQQDWKLIRRELDNGIPVTQFQEFEYCYLNRKQIRWRYIGNAFLGLQNRHFWQSDTFTFFCWKGRWGQISIKLA